MPETLTYEERLAGLKALVERLSGEPDAKDDAFFMRSVQDAATFSAIEDADLAEKFGTSRPTLTRWRLGVTGPHPAMRPSIFRVLKTHAEEAIRVLEAV